MERTLARLRALRSDLFDPTIALHHGRVVKRTGDGVLVEFRSVVDAVRCAIELQNGMAERNAGLSAERRIEFRVGIHLGDVVEESDGDLMGDGVNIAARCEASQHAPDTDFQAASSSSGAFASLRSRVSNPLGEPAVDRSEKLPCLILLTLIAPEPRHAHCGAEFFWLLYDLTHKVIHRGRQRCAAWQSQPEIGRCETTWSTGSINQLTSSVSGPHP